MGAGIVLSHPRLPNSSPGYFFWEMLHSCIGCVNVSRDHSKKLEKVFHTVLKIPGKVGLNFKGRLRFFFLIYNFFLSKRDPGRGQWCPGTSERKEGGERCRQASPVADRPVLIPLEVSEEGREDAEEELAGISRSWHWQQAGPSHGTAIFPRSPRCPQSPSMRDCCGLARSCECSEPHTGSFGMGFMGRLV